MNSTPNVKIAHDFHIPGTACFDQIIQDLIGHLFMKDPFVTVGPEVKFQGFEFNTELGGDVGNPDRCKIRLSRPGAKTGKLRTLKADFVTALRSRIRKGFKMLRQS